MYTYLFLQLIILEPICIYVKSTTEGSVLEMTFVQYFVKTIKIALHISFHMIASIKHKQNPFMKYK